MSTRPWLVLTRPDKDPQHTPDAGNDDADSRLLRLPLIRLLPSAPHPALLEQLRWAAQAQLLIFVSRAAVDCTHQLAPQLAHNRGARWCAVGPATARRLQQLFDVEVLQPTASAAHSEGLLALLPNVQDLHCALFAAPDGRTLLEQELRKRGAVVQSVLVYRRQLLPPHPAQLAMLHDRHGQLVFSATSVQLLHALAQLLTQLGWALPHIPLIVSAPRIAEAARALGFLHIRVAHSAAPADLQLLMEPPWPC